MEKLLPIEGQNATKKNRNKKLFSKKMFEKVFFSLFG
jgi:hypothetical protein